MGFSYLLRQVFTGKQTQLWGMTHRDSGQGVGLGVREGPGFHQRPQDQGLVYGLEGESPLLFGPAGEPGSEKHGMEWVTG